MPRDVDLLTDFQRQSSLSENALKDYAFEGRHLIVNYLKCDHEALVNLPRLIEAMKRAVKASGATLLKYAEHIFPSSGFTVVMLLSESHASIHTYPEHDSCFVDLFTCGTSCNPEEFDRVMRSYLNPAGCSCKLLSRGQEINEEEKE